MRTQSQAGGALTRPSTSQGGPKSSLTPGLPNMSSAMMASWSSTSRPGTSAHWMPLCLSYSPVSVLPLRRLCELIYLSTKDFTFSADLVQTLVWMVSLAEKYLVILCPSQSCWRHRPAVSVGHACGGRPRGHHPLGASAPEACLQAPASPLPSAVQRAPRTPSLQDL